MSGESDVRSLYLDGKSKWPDVSLELPAFASHCARIAAADPSAPPPRDAAELFLVCACLAGDLVALRAFERDWLPVARAAIARIVREPDLTAELMQELRSKLLLGPDLKLERFSGQGPLKAWLRVTATRIAFDHCRLRGLHPARFVELSERLAAPDHGPEVAFLKARYGAALQQALKGAVALLPARERNVLRMHVAGQCSIDEIGRAYNVHRATAARWIERARAFIYETARVELKLDRAQLTQSEFKSLVMLFGSELELHLSGASVASAARAISTIQPRGPEAACESTRS